MPGILEDAGNGLNHASRALINDLSEHLKELNEHIRGYDEQVREMASSNEDCKRIMTIPEIGPLTATAMQKAMGDPNNFVSGRHVAAWLDLVPR